MSDCTVTGVTMAPVELMAPEKLDGRGLLLHLGRVPFFGGGGPVGSEGVERAFPGADIDYAVSDGRGVMPKALILFSLIAPEQISVCGLQGVQESITGDRVYDAVGD